MTTALVRTYDARDVTRSAGRWLAPYERRLARARGRLEMLLREARIALQAGREDVARLALVRRRLTLAEIEELEARLADIRKAAASFDARSSALDRLLRASLAEVPAHSSAPQGRYPAAIEGDLEVESQLRALLSEQEAVTKEDERGTR